MKYAYIAEPIDQSPQAHGVGVLMQLRGLRVNYYAPRHAWNAPRPPYPPLIQATNMMALGGASVVVAILPKDVASIGVPMEMQYAIDHKIPLVVMSDRTRTDSAMLSSIDCVWCTSALQAAREAQALLTEPVLFEELERPAQIRAFYTGSGEPPRTHKSGDAGYDLTCSESVVVAPMDRVSIPCDIAVQLPDGYWCLIQGRSSSWRRGLSVKASIIDAGYRGALWVDCWNITNEPVEVNTGERIAQLIPMALPPDLDWCYVPELGATERGASGYGSTGL